MSNLSKTVVIGFLGTVLDRADGPDRWNAWRPTLSLFQHPELRIDRFECLMEPKAESLARQVAEDIRQVSPETTVTLHPVPLSDPWDFEEVFARLHRLSREWTFDTTDTQYLVHITTGSHVQQICLFLLTESRHFPAALIQTAPPKRIGSQSPGRYNIIHLDLSRYNQIMARFQEDSADARVFLKMGIPTRNPDFNQLIESIEEVALYSKAPILLTGPTGSGKSHLARRIYELKHSRNQIQGPFVEVNCATLRGDAARSALFGHVRGAFTGAVQTRRGHLLSAHGGVLFLDEIGELGLDEQAQLLKAVEEHRFYPVGSDRELRSDFQLIAGTNQDLGAAVARGRFREDLLARIQLWSFTLPSLRERLEDIEPNLDYELELFAREHGRRIALDRDARQRFLDFATSSEARWLGNFRDLNGAIYRMATLSTPRGGRIHQRLVEAEMERLRAQWRQPSHPAKDGRTSSEVPAEQSLYPQAALPAEFENCLDPFDAVQLAHVLHVCGQSASLSEAGRRLFAKSRLQRKQPNDADRLRKYLQRYNLNTKVLGSGG